MQKNSFYVDSCIYLNIWQKEGDEKKGKPYWKRGNEFFEKYENNIIYYSGFILKELKYILSENEYKNKRILFETLSNFKKIKANRTDIETARNIESELNFEISFFDIIHMILAIKTDSILITRDKKFIESARKYTKNVKRPEEFL